MIDWLRGLPFVWLVVVVSGVTYLVAAAISWVVSRPRREQGLSWQSRPGPRSFAGG
jgi:hypothetical protein